MEPQIGELTEILNRYFSDARVLVKSLIGNQAVMGQIQAETLNYIVHRESGSGVVRVFPKDAIVLESYTFVKRERNE